MYGIYAHKRYVDTEEEYDEELCMPDRSRDSPSLQEQARHAGVSSTAGRGVVKTDDDVKQQASKMKAPHHHAKHSYQHKHRNNKNVHSSARPPSQVANTMQTRESVPTGGPSVDQKVSSSDKKKVAAADVAPHQDFTPRARVKPRDDRMPGAFHDDGRNARDITMNDEWDARSDVQSEPNLVSAEVVDPDETRRIVERELAEQQRKAAVAEVVTGFWCSKRVKIMGGVGVLLVLVAVVLGTVLPRVLEPPEPTEAPTAAPTPVEPYLIDVLSDISPDDGVALLTPFTPQNNALNWLVNNTNLDVYSIEKKIQRYVLATLFYGTNGNNWRYNTLWLSDDDECGWYNNAEESFCMNGAVVELDMYDDSGNNLVGTIPNEIALMSNSLRELQLAENKLSGAIPSEIGVCSKLNEVSLWNNSLTGTLPSEIGSLANLIWLNLRSNSLMGTVTSEIGMLTNSNTLSISINKLTGTIPSEIGLLTSLSSLYLYDNDLTGTIPSEIDLLTNLDVLALHENGFTGNYTCPDYISFCYISCANDTDDCRSLAEPTAEPSTTAPSSLGGITVPPTNSPQATASPTEPPSPRPTPPSSTVETADPSTEQPALVCGDGILENGEECEPSGPFCPDGQYCVDCLCIGCGNGRIDEGERCDFKAEPDGCGKISYCRSDCTCGVVLEKRPPVNFFP